MSTMELQLELTYWGLFNHELNKNSNSAFSYNIENEIKCNRYKTIAFFSIFRTGR